MNLEEFKKLHYQFSKLPLPKEIWSSKEYDDYIGTLNSNKEFYEWTLSDKFKTSGFNHDGFCCLEMANKIFESLDKNGENIFNDVDIVMRKWDDGTYGIPIHDGGSSIIEIKHCPWCGTELKKASS